MPSTIRPLALLAALAASQLAQNPPSQNPADHGRLHPPASRRVTLAPGAIHRFLIDAPSGRFLRVQVEKQGIDLSLAILDSQGREIASSANRSGAYGREFAAVITGQASYTVQITAQSDFNFSAPYRLSIDVRPAAAADALEIKAHALLRDGLDHELPGDDAGLHLAIQSYTQAADLFARLRQPYFQALALHRIGLAHDSLHQWDPALKFYNQALMLRRQANDRAGEASTLNNIGLVYAKREDQPKALDFLSQGLRIRRQIHDRAGQAASLFNLASASDGRAALDYFHQSLAISQVIGDRPRAAITLRRIGDTVYQLGDKRQAVDAYQQALAVSRALGDRRSEALLLNYLATTSLELGDSRQSLDYHTQSLAAYHSLGDSARESSELDSIGSLYSQVLADKQKALDFYNQALPLRRAAHDSQGESDSLNNIGTVYNSLGDALKALDNFNSALAIRRRLNDRAGEAQTLDNIGALYFLTGDPRKALEYYSQALPIQHALANRSGEAAILTNMGGGYVAIAETQKALDVLTQALEIERSLQDRFSEASTLCNIGGVYAAMGQPQQTLDYCNQALAIDRAIGAHAHEAHELNMIGRAYADLAEQQKAIETYNQALAAGRSTADRGEQAATLDNLAHTYAILGDFNRASDLYNQSLALNSYLGNRTDQARGLANLGNLYIHLNDPGKALDYFSQARALFDSTGDRSGVANVLNSMGDISDQRGDYQKAIDLYNQSLAIHRAAADRSGVASSLNNLGSVYDELGDKSKALDFYQQALAIFHANGDRENEAKVLSNLRVLFLPDQPDLAILFGKQAVNLLQSVRRSNRDLEDSLRRSYEHTIESNYRNLAALLVERQRFAEAEEVLSLLKDKEAGLFLERDSVSSEVRSATLLDTEKAALARYEQVAGQVAELGEKKAALVAKSETASLTAAERAQSDQLDKDLGAANIVLHRFFDEEEKSLAADSAAARRVSEFREAEGDQSTLADLGPGVVAIYTLVAPEKYIALLVTPAARKAYTTAIKQADLNAKIFAFRQQLQDPASDPLPLARELYSIVFPEGLRQDLDSIQAKTVMWSMDGVLRYIPIAALHDGHDYLVARFRNSLITPASMNNLTETPKAHWQGLGFGVSQAKAGFSALPSVPAELHGIFRQPGDTAAPLPGSIRLDADFTRDAFLNDLRQPNDNVVHIATHFDSRPLAANSVLLLGDGQSWSLQEIHSVPRLFHGVDLLTLSACSTAFSNRSEDGREVDSFGTIAQQLGARAVIASLWSVSDEATALLMRTMYRLREENPAMGKSEALRQAQAALASGSLRPDTAAASSDRGVSPAHPIAAPAVRDWRHPYYWAPFILIGNWK